MTYKFFHITCHFRNKSKQFFSEIETVIYFWAAVGNFFEIGKKREDILNGIFSISIQWT